MSIMILKLTWPRYIAVLYFKGSKYRKTDVLVLGGIYIGHKLLDKEIFQNSKQTHYNGTYKVGG